MAAREIVLTGGDPLLGATIAGRYTIVARLGTGSMGAVYRARQESIGAEVALKVLRSDRVVDGDTRVRFLREARATSMLTSPHTVTVLDFGEAEDGSWFLAMELLEGETLGQRLRRVGRLPPAQALLIARQALLSLAEAHAKGIVHRDLKPDNLFLVRSPGSGGSGIDAPLEHCKVLDFGIAKVARDEEAFVDPLETQKGTVFGTPRYMSPEQAQGGVIDARSDLYSLGVLLYQMLAGRPPFVDDDAIVVMARHVRDRPPDIGAVAPGLRLPARFEALVRRALGKSAAERPQSADEFIAEIDSLVHEPDQEPGAAHAAWEAPGAALEPRQDGGFWAWRSRVAPVVVTASLLCATAFGIFSMLQAANVPRSVNNANPTQPAPAVAAAALRPRAVALEAPQAPSAGHTPPLPSSRLARAPRVPAAKPAVDRDSAPVKRARDLGR